MFPLILSVHSKTLAIEEIPLRSIRSMELHQDRKGSRNFVKLDEIDEAFRNERSTFWIEILCWTKRSILKRYDGAYDTSYRSCWRREVTLIRADERNWRGPVARLCELPRSEAERSVARRTSLCAARAELAQARRLSRTSGASNSFANPLQARQDDTYWFCSHRYRKGTDICGLDVRNQLSLWSFLWGGKWHARE